MMWSETMLQANDSPTIQINGRSEPLAAANLAALLDAKADEIPARGIAIALNGSVVPRASWPTTPLNDGDRIEIVRVMQGG
jgi:sulfur carrier protein